MTSPQSITSAGNPRVKAAVRLRDRSERDATGLTIVDGTREIARALDANVEVVESFVSEDLPQSTDALGVVGALERTGAPVTQVSKHVMAKLAFGDRTDGVIAIIRPPSARLADLTLPPNPLVVVVESVEKPGNLGAVLRTADGAGADAVIAADPLTDVFNPNAIRASLGTIFRLPLAVAASGEVLDWLSRQGIHALATRVDAPTRYTDIDLRESVAIIVGSESTGLTATWRGQQVTPVRIPMLGAGDSLNVSVAAAILLYEAVRQRT
jgi:RNA methyltransferase, TrmH family